MPPIDHVHLRKLDLNLLLALDALLHEASVTRAARKLSVGQPAMSHALARLRELLQDPLLVRQGNALVATPRASALILPLRAALHELQELTRQAAPFDPASSHAIFRISSCAHIETVIFPQLLRSVARIAPHVQLISVHSRRTDVLTLLDQGEFELGVGVFSDGKPWHRSELLFTDGFALLFDPDFGDATELQRFLARPHALVTTQGDLSGRLDEILDASDRARCVMVSTPNVLSLPHIIPGTPIVACVPRSLACALCNPRLTIGTPPVDLGEFAVRMMWHERDEIEPAHNWLRVRLREAAAQYPRIEFEAAGCQSGRGFPNSNVPLTVAIVDMK